MEYKIIRLVDKPEMKEQMANWFHEKWGVPLEAYLESMDECLLENKAVPQWYVTIEGNRIIGGMGVIENDFHNRKDRKCLVSGWILSTPFLLYNCS